jgi:hypothetical protein
MGYHPGRKPILRGGLHISGCHPSLLPKLAPVSVPNMPPVTSMTPPGTMAAAFRDILQASSAALPAPAAPTAKIAQYASGERSKSHGTSAAGVTLDAEHLSKIVSRKHPGSINVPASPAPTVSDKLPETLNMSTAHVVDLDTEMPPPVPESIREENKEGGTLMIHFRRGVDPPVGVETPAEIMPTMSRGTLTVGLIADEVPYPRILPIFFPMSNYACVYSLVPTAL